MKTKFILFAGVCLLGLAIIIHFKPHPTNSSDPTQLREATFADLPHWSSAKTSRSLQAFKRSCRAFLHQAPQQAVGNDMIVLQAQNWFPACRAAMALSESVSSSQARKFFETWFTPVFFAKGKPITGLFTGYYVPQFPGSLVQTKEYSVPIYTAPPDRIVVKLHDFDASLPRRTLVGRLRHQQLLPYPTRAEINQGALGGQAHVLVWVKSAIDRLFLEIQGSGQIQLPDGEMMYLGYAGGNGAPYTPIGRVLVQRGLMPQEQVSMPSIRAYLEAHPELAEDIINQNQSVVFFKRYRASDALGTQGVALTPGYSLAVDTQWVPLGCPVWLQTTRPDAKTENQLPFSRLLVAQDTGGAIRGSVRGDVFWGSGVTASLIAGKMKNSGRYWLLLPKPVRLN